MRWLSRCSLIGLMDDAQGPRDPSVFDAALQ
jgi:hypothetical protein